MTVRPLLAAAAALALLAGPSAAAEPSPVLAPVCAEPGGQTDTPPHPRLRRAVVDGVPVAVVLPPGYGRSDRRYPVLYLLHGAQGDEDSWIEYGDLLRASATSEPAVVVMPKMGVVTGLAVDWVDGHRRDATFVTRTLVDWADRTFRTKADRRHRAIAGYSGGALSAAHLAEVAPGTFSALGVLSGPVDLTNPATQPGTYAALKAEQVCAGDDPAAAGPLGDPVTHAEVWRAADPMQSAARLRHTTVWLSSGNGVPCTPEEAAYLAYPTAATEPGIRRSTDALSAALTAAGVRHTNVHRPCGLHWWSTWAPDLAAFWDVAARRW